MRTLRNVILQRTDRHAEWEIRKVFAEVADIALENWPNLFQDFKGELVDGIMEYTTPNGKV